jgi:hypothetical protein
MADLNLFTGGYGRSFGSDANAGQFPSIYPAPARVASHHKPHIFTLDERFGPFVELPGVNSNPAVDYNQAFALRSIAPTVPLQTSGLIGKTLGIHRIPVNHLITSLFVHAHGGTNGAGLTYDIFINRVNPRTGALVATVTVPAALLGLTMPAADTAADVWAGLAPELGGMFTGPDVFEIGVKILTVPAATATWSGLVADTDLHISVLAKVEAFDPR